MSNLLSFPVAATDARDAGTDFLLNPQPHSHAVQFYESDEFLFETAGQFLAAGLKADDVLVVIAAQPHREGLMRHLEHQGGLPAVAQGQLVLLDARETMARFMIGDMPDADLFREVIDGVLRTLRDGYPGARVRAYGEMVDLLWRDGNARAAIRLEELWNDAGKDHGFSLLCAYVMGHFYKEGDAAHFMEVCRSHSHVIPTESFRAIDDPLARLREISLLQQRARALEGEIHHRKELENALRDSLRERARVEEDLRACVKREVDARERAEASDAFKEMFLGILGHDLRNPLNTVLTTARLMKARGELADDSERRIDRIVTSGVRMQRMIDQLLDVARARLSDGIPVTRTRQDIEPLVGKIVEEVRAANPNRVIDFRTDGGPCHALVDGDRFEQVVSNLLGNAIVHGDAEHPITVTVTTRDAMTCLSVHNFGPPIDPALIPALFDPFRRGATAKDGGRGLGLGLYIVDRIVDAHEGTVAVRSAPSTGTTFEVAFPRGEA